MKTTKISTRRRNKNGNAKNGKRVSKEISISRFVEKFYAEHGKIMTKLAYE